MAPGVGEVHEAVSRPRNCDGFRPLATIARTISAAFRNVFLISFEIGESANRGFDGFTINLASDDVGFLVPNLHPEA